MAKNARLQLLERGEAQGVLRPEHIKELASLRAASGGRGAGGSVKVEANDRKSLMEAADRSAAAGQSLRLYDSVKPAIDRFDGGPLKGAVYDAVMPNEGGGFMDGLGAFVGAPIRALLPSQSKDDYQRISAAQSERVALRQKEQKGPQTDKDAAMYRRADISPTRTTAVNHDLIDRNKNESNLVRLRSQLEAKWVGRYGSTSHSSPNGMTFAQATDMAERDFQRSMAARRQAPPSTRAASGWSATEMK